MNKQIEGKPHYRYGVHHFFGETQYIRVENGIWKTPFHIMRTRDDGCR